MIVGTAGHIDHGKSSLVKALTGVDPDRLKEEKARGITIDLGFAYTGEGEDEIGFVDVPGHDRLVHTMLAGAHGVDVLMLVVAADDGVMPQTREHLAIAELLGLNRAVVALTKIDRVPIERLGAAQGETRALLNASVFASAPIFPVSVVSGEGLDSLRQALRRVGRDANRRDRSGLFRMAIDRSFTLPGAGTVVTGTVLGGEAAPGDRVVVSPSGLTARIRGMRVQNRDAERAVAGDRAALNLAGDGVTRDAVSRGDMVLSPILHAPSDRMDARLKVLSSETRPVTQWMPVRFHHATADVGARIVLLSDDPIPPGGEAFVQLVLDAPVAACCGDRFVLRDTSAQRTVGGGRLVDLRAPARKRRSPERFGQLEALAIADPAEALSALLDRPPHLIELEGFARDRGLSTTRLDGLIEETRAIRVAAPRATLALSAATWLRLKRGIVERLETFHAENPDLAGIGMERLRMSVEPRIPAPAFTALLQSLARAGTTALDGAWVKLPGHVVRMLPEDERLWQRIEPLLAASERFRPPRVRDIAHLLGSNEIEVRRVMKMLARMGRADEIDHDHFFLRETVAEIVELAAELAAVLPDGQFTAAHLRDRLDNGRKVAILILEFLDRHGVTIRRGDMRRMNRHRLDLFRRPGGKDDAQEETSHGRDASPVGRPDFKSGRGRETVLGGFDSHSLPPHS
jgi:selenocysteine-specific elongation factor